ncbi:hypothetical protein BABINDRAFT_162772 [Babjeviella inositovora NRRL Y-12698]|uniref:V-type proton ATPase subunit C n=1 Tax=Babjeviella inositovora NRRL Y-12698 TaxID=984486 RepID=A0A1E3QLJ1_9ASCO|nr:uncharacterized protein BABINDRAFT_162772 [Babjeviella inositovora NRRL Y-12698]ODQ78566.1 hypothetical protein BABINDRAFT_162772 [Babjeviella inositovora NRRL Y-12698]
MESIANYLLLSLPQSSYSSDAALKHWLEENVARLTAASLVTNFAIPDFKIGTLDSLVNEVEDLAKLDVQFQQSLSKIVDIYGAVYESRAVNEHKRVNNVEVGQYVRQFRWNTSKYRLDKSVGDLVSLITSDVAAVETDLRAVYSAYQQAKNALVSAARKNNGDLTVKSLHDIVSKDDFVVDSEYLTTVLVVVPKALQAQFVASYETLTSYVVPRSAKLLSSDSEFQLYSVTLFKKFAAEFALRCREQKWHPRDFNYSEESVNALRQEYNVAGSQEKQLKRELTVLATTAYSEVTAALFHIKALRVYCESVLRYGLPPQFYIYLIEVKAKDINRAKNVLVDQFGHLGGNAFNVDKNGKIKKNDAGLSEYASLVDTEYEPFVVYEVAIL